MFFVETMSTILKKYTDELTLSEWIWHIMQQLKQCLLGPGAVFEWWY
jgi:hypothetical protein